jgi:tRNA(Ile)-lysidine synthase TilS/MesJ
MRVVCTRCVLDSNFPGITFNEKGVCNFCDKDSRINQYGKQRNQWEDKFQQLLKDHRGHGLYDGLVALSGGKDSTYTLILLKNKYKLNLLAFTFDNWFQSPRAMENIKKITAHLNIDHLTIRPGFDDFRAMMQLAAEKDIFPRKAMERATSICTICLSLIRFAGLKLAVEKNIPILFLGMSPGQAPAITSIYKLNSEMARKMQAAVYCPLYKELGDLTQPYFLEERHFLMKENMPYIVNPLAFQEYGEKIIYEAIENYGWRTPENTDSNSSNCLLNAYANRLHQEKYGYHPYSYEIAGLVRGGHMRRADGLLKLEARMDDAVIKQVKIKLYGNAR